MRVLGLNSGTSMDGIDAAVIDIRGEPANLSYELLAFETVPYPPGVRLALERMDQPAWQGVGHLSSLHVAVGHAFADAAAQALRSTDRVSLVASHGQTIFHDPQPKATSDRWPSTLQLGEPSVIAQRTGITTVADFRVADVAAGGQGAPVVSYVDYLTLRSHHQYRAVLNIGGVANLTLLPAGCGLDAVSAFDTGPGNMLIDAGARFLESGDFDVDGRASALGCVHAPLLEWLLAHPYFERRPPKTTGRDAFGAAYFKEVRERARELGCSGDDLMATLCELSACSVAACVPPECTLIIAAGGGCHNAALMNRIRENLERMGRALRVAPSDEFGFPVDAKEAMAFAILGRETIYGRRNTLPGATGAERPVTMGKIVPGDNFSALMQSVWGSR